MLYDELPMVKSDKIKIEVAGTLGMQELDPCRKLTLFKPAEVVLVS